VEGEVNVDISGTTPCISGAGVPCLLLGASSSELFTEGWRSIVGLLLRAGLLSAGLCER